MQEIDCCLLFW